jgi:hypothetical protein
MYKRWLGTLLAVLSILVVTCSSQQPRLLETYAKPPLRFESNDSQSGGQVKFVARGGRYTLCLSTASQSFEHLADALLPLGMMI